MCTWIESIESQLTNFNAEKRKEALVTLSVAIASGTIDLPPLGDTFNLHCHSFFSFNGYGYSPSHLAWLGRKHGLCAMALVDFDVLDGVEEFLEATHLLGIKAGAGFETRVFVSDFADDEINSPGEPGIAYHIGMGFIEREPKNPELLYRLKELAQRRIQTIIERVNTLLEEIKVDYHTDVMPLTPSGNPTERHICAAYDHRSRSVFPERSQRITYWSSKLGMSPSEIDRVLDVSPEFQGIIRSKTMKSGGAGYIPAKGSDFPNLEEVNSFILSNGALPTFAFLDGMSSGEQRMEELLDTMVRSGVVAANIIPDRNWNIKDPVLRRLKVEKLVAFIEQAETLHLPIFIGTEMNAYGQRFVDDFSASELKPFLEIFRQGMFVLHAHTMLQRYCGMGYVSDWACQEFSSPCEKKLFFAELGKRISPQDGPLLRTLTKSMTSGEILNRIGY